MNGSAFKTECYNNFRSRGVRTEDVAKRMGINLRTLRYKLADPDLLTRKEIYYLTGYVKRETILMICPWWQEGGKDA